jgi:hypothetical protein
MADDATKGAQGTTEPPKGDEAAAAAAAKATADADAAAKATADAAAKKATDDAAAAAAGAAEGVKGKGKAAAAAGAPEKYTLAIPDDGKVHIDDADVKEFETMARKAGWTNDEAQAAIDEHLTLVKATSEKFLADTKADTDYGGDNLAETQRLAKLGIDLIRPAGHARREGFTRFLNKVGGGNHIEVVSFLADLGRRASEDNPGQTSSAQLRGQKTAESVLYDNTPKT